MVLVAVSHTPTLHPPPRHFLANCEGGGLREIDSVSQRTVGHLLDELHGPDLIIDQDEGAGFRSKVWRYRHKFLVQAVEVVRRDTA